MYYDNENLQPEDRQENGSYRTGRTNPPKNRRGIFAALMVIVIFLGGIISVLGFLNIKLFQRLHSGNPDDPGFFQFADDPTAATEASGTTQATLPPASPDNSLQLQLQQSPPSVENIPQAGGLSLQAIYAETIDSVLSIICTTRSGSSTGTGVAISAEGYAVTNAHVVEDARSVQVLLQDGSIHQATIVGKDDISDLAVLFVQDAALKPAAFGDSAALRVGDAVVAIGDPLGTELRGTMTDGIVSAINRDLTTGGRKMTLIQTNAALNAGNSGGPLLNCYGQVIGINTMKIGDYVNSAGVEGLGFAIPSTTVKDVVDQLIAKGYVSGRPSLGFTGSAVSSFDRLYYRLPQGIYITTVTENSTAAKQGIQPGDILLAIDNTRITDEAGLTAAMYAYNAGDTVTLTLYRAGAQHQLSLVLEQQQ